MITPKNYEITINKIKMFKSCITGEMFIRLSWSANVGFGQLDIHKQGKKWVAETECMGKEFLRQALVAMAEKITVIE